MLGRSLLSVVPHTSTAGHLPPSKEACASAPRREWMPLHTSQSHAACSPSSTQWTGTRLQMTSREQGMMRGKAGKKKKRACV